MKTPKHEGRKPYNRQSERQRLNNLFEECDTLIMDKLTRTSTKDELEKIEVDFERSKNEELRAILVNDIIIDINNQFDHELLRIPPI